MPRLGLGSLELSSLGGTGQDVVTTIDDFFFESHTSGEVTPMQTASRTNLIPYSNEFTNSGGSGWILHSDYTLTANNIVSPDGTQNATKVTLPAGNGALRTHLMSVSPNTSYVFSFFAKRGTASEMKYRVFDYTDPYVDIVSKTSYYSQTNTDTWVRIEVPFTTSSATNVISLYIDSDGQGDGYFYAYGAQLEQDGFASAYIPTSGSTVTVSTTLNDTSEVWDFDSTDITLEADPEDEGFWEEGSNLVLNHDYEELGSEQLRNGTFDTDSEWIKSGSWSISDGTANNSESGSETFAQSLTSALVSGKTYKVVYTISGYSGSGIVKAQFVGGGTLSGTNRTANGTHTEYLTATANHTSVRLKALSNNGGFTGNIDNFSVKQVDPNDRWTLSNTTIEDGALTFTDNSSAIQYAFQDNVVTEGNVYEITLTVNRTSGTLNVLFGTGGNSVTGIGSITSSGTYTFITTPLTSAQSGNGRFWPGYTSASDNFIGIVDNVTVREYAVQPKDI